LEAAARGECPQPRKPGRPRIRTVASEDKPKRKPGRPCREVPLTEEEIKERKARYYANYKAKRQAEAAERKQAKQGRVNIIGEILHTLEALDINSKLFNFSHIKQISCCKYKV
jgi:hypothetical protein